MAYHVGIAQTREMDDVRALFLEYAQEWPGPEFDLQGFDAELAALPVPYAAPRGCIVLACDGTRPMGCIALKSIDARTCEAKRLYLRPPLRGRGLGRRLVQRLIMEAGARGYSRILLDTTPEMHAAIATYEASGFRRIGRYHEATAEDAIFMERRLDEA
jgi:GNAT superfamily N-acetyltransferase